MDKKPKIALVALPPLNTRFPALNIALLTGELKQHGYATKAFDLNIQAFEDSGEAGRFLWDFRNGYLWNEPDYFAHEIYPKFLQPHIDRWLQQILNFEPNIVGFSVTPSELCYVLAREIKERSPSTKIIFGGPMCSHVMKVERFFPNEWVDAVVSDEGEATLVDLVKNYETTGSFAAIPGTTVIMDDKPVFGGMREAIKDLNSTAFPDFDDLDLSLYREPYDTKPSWELPIYTSRGCVGRCNFCMDYKMWSVYYRQKSPTRVADEMTYFAKKFGVTNFIFIELVFNGHHGWIMKFAEELKNRNTNFSFWSHGRMDGRLTPELLKALRSVGFWHFMFGMESASNKVLKLMRKGTTKEKALANLNDCVNANISASINIIVGFPGETFLDFLETLFFVVRHRKLIWIVPSITACQATPGTDLYEQPEKFQIKVEKSVANGARDWVSYDGKNNYRERQRRVKIMEFVFARIVFRAHEHQTRRYTYRWWRDIVLASLLAGTENLLVLMQSLSWPRPLVSKPE